MKVVEEEFWTKMTLPAMFIVTTNGAIGDDGELVMGLGIAREATWKIKGLQKTCGKAITENFSPISKNNYKYLYYFLPVLENEGKNFLGLFQVKLDWRTSADLDIIEKSCQGLVRYMDEHPNVTYRMVYPAIGAGRLSIKEVHPILEKYFSNKKITFCMRANSYMEYLNYMTNRTLLSSPFCDGIGDGEDDERGIDSSFSAIDYFNNEWEQTRARINGGL